MKREAKENLPMKLAVRLGRISGYSFMLVIMTFLGLYGGMRLDRATGMAPNFTLVGLITGAVMGFMSFIHEVIVERKAKQDENNPHKASV